MIRRLVCRYVGHVPRKIKVARYEVDLETGRQMAAVVVLMECARCLESLL